jgi:NAD(P)-dependent dehydrogenase (short-subunit alcohol dehydrogenase family)
MKILVTGGSRGIGKAIVTLFKENGHSVYSPTREELDLTKNFILVKTDFDIIINNAGINPLKYIEESYNRGMAAWRTGHRPGATEQQWGYARVHSFLLCGKTYFSTDSDIARRAKSQSSRARDWWKSRGC